jgi:hypothetical protein
LAIEDHMTSQAYRFCQRAALLLIFHGGVATAAHAEPVPITVLDTLRGISTSTVFDAVGSGGLVVSGDQLVGPLFTVPDRFVLTEIGAFANLCNLTGGDPSCRSTSPLTVQIRNALPSGPDLSNVIASFVLSSDDDPMHVSFERASAQLSLPAGQYFALFVPLDSNFGNLLGIASSPFGFVPVTTSGAVVHPYGNSVILTDIAAAIRIQGTQDRAPVPEPATVLLVGAGAVALVRRRPRNGQR